MKKMILAKAAVCALFGVVTAQSQATEVYAPGANIHAGPVAGWGHGPGWFYNYERGRGGQISGPGWSVNFGPGNYLNACLHQHGQQGHGDLRRRR